MTKHNVWMIEGVNGKFEKFKSLVYKRRISRASASMRAMKMSSCSAGVGLESSCLTRLLFRCSHFSSTLPVHNKYQNILNWTISVEAILTNFENRRIYSSSHVNVVQRTASEGPHNRPMTLSKQFINVFFEKWQFSLTNVISTQNFLKCLVAK